MNEKTVGNKMKHYDNDDYNENDSGNSHVQRNVSCKEQDLKSKIIYHAFFQSWRSYDTDFSVSNASMMRVQTSSNHPGLFVCFPGSILKFHVPSEKNTNLAWGKNLNPDTQTFRAENYLFWQPSYSRKSLHQSPASGAPRNIRPQKFAPSCRRCKPCSPPGPWELLGGFFPTKHGFNGRSYTREPGT